MKRIFLTTMVVLMGVLCAEADGVSVPNVAINVGQPTTAAISLTNTNTGYVSFQMDLTLPEGVTINKASCSLTSRVTDQNQELTIGKQSDNVYRLTSTSFALTPISGTSGELITLSLSASADCSGGQATLTNIRFATASSQRVTMNNASFNIIVVKPSATVTTAPTAKTLTYTGSSQQLVNAGSASGGTMQYSLDGSAYSTTIPTGTNAGNYTVYYKVVGDATHSDSNPSTVSASIAAKTVSSPTITLSQTSYTYDGTAKTPTIPISPPQIP